ncbi:hypothetical protein GSI_07439 [Ganoderma sinense ZZ0214-1]|uniref:Uncharacterized protein n=1 Tax=Ganoderma sinense ZZ0214-1 TaxID=1077348 RepID=A0A2G8S918_9APHY|nr:hypothetical protein GSI_07439 [Ganoderma sinense ZZ0214-1]
MRTSAASSLVLSLGFLSGVVSHPCIWYVPYVPFLTSSLQRFHANKAIIIDLGIRDHFHFPKLHSLDHYITSIKLFGTTDNYDTQHTERLHIDFAKEAYRATTRKDEFPQMTLWLERREKVLRHGAYIQWHLSRFISGPSDRGDRRTAASTSSTSSSESSLVPLHAASPPLPCFPSVTQPQPVPTRMKLAKWPTVKALTFPAATQLYGAVFHVGGST